MANMIWIFNTFTTFPNGFEEAVKKNTPSRCLKIRFFSSTFKFKTKAWLLSLTFNLFCPAKDNKVKCKY